MQKIKPAKARIAVLVAFFAFSLGSQSVFAQLKPDIIRQKTFEKAWQITNDKFWDASFGGIDWKAVRSRYSPLVASAGSDAEFYDLLNKMLAELKTSHMLVLPPDKIEQMKQAPISVGFMCRDVEGRVVVTRVFENSSAAKAGLKPGFVISKVDGQLVQTYADARKQFNGPLGSQVRIEYIDANDAVHEAAIIRTTITEQNKSDIAGLKLYALFDNKRLAGNVGYIYFSNFAASLDERLKAAVDSMHDAPGIIIDLRGNSGGDDSVAVNLASLFFEKETRLMVTKTRKGDNFDYKARPTANAFKGKVAILLDEYSGSASEQFAAGMQAVGRAVIVGRRSMGSDMDGDVAQLPDGSIFIYAAGQPQTLTGYVVEKNGVKPDLPVTLTRKELLAGKDPDIEAALQYITKN